MADGYLTSHRSSESAGDLQPKRPLRCNWSRYCSEREGIRAAVFHEGMSIIERDRAAAWFAEEDTGAPGTAVLGNRF